VEQQEEFIYLIRSYQRLISNPPNATALVPKNDSKGQPQSQPPQTASNDAEGIPLLVEGGTFVIPVLINGQITLNFTIDSGAADVSIPADVVSTLMRTGALQKSDFVGQKIYRLADGSTVPSATFLIRSLKVGSHLLENVMGSVASAQADLLLGQSFLSRFNSWSIDNKRQVLLLN
jgi:clan AA aspartic protease (TIGR02281 family)